jgi:hypothetical protein
MLQDGFTAAHQVAMRVHWWSAGGRGSHDSGNSEVRWKLPTASVQTNVCRLTTMAELVDARTRGDTVPSEAQALKGTGLAAQRMNREFKSTGRKKTSRSV